MQTLGQKLREEREKRGWTIAQVAEALRISPSYFEAIEQDRHDALPGGFFYRSFVRQYARLLELPEADYKDELARVLEADLAVSATRMETFAHRHIDVPPLPTNTVDRAKETRKWLIGLGLLVLVAAGASGLYKLYLEWRPAEGATAGASGAITPPVQVPESKPIETPPAESAPATAEHQTPATGEPPATSPGAAAQPSTTPPAPTTATPPAAQSAAQPPAAGPIQITLTARELTWVDVVADGKRVLMRALEPGESQSFGAGTAIRLRTGNAGGLRVVYNGKVIESVGPTGQVRTVTFTPQSYQILQPLPPTGAAPKPDPSKSSTPPSQP